MYMSTMSIAMPYLGLHNVPDVQGAVTYVANLVVVLGSYIAHSYR